MAYTAHDPRTFYDAIVTRLSGQTSKNIGEANAPSDTTTPYAVVYQLDEQDNPETLGNLTDAHESTFFAWQVTSVGADANEAQWMQQKVRAALLGWQPTVSGITCGFVERDGGTGVTRDDDLQPPLFYAVDRFVCFASA